MVLVLIIIVSCVQRCWVIYFGWLDAHCLKFYPCFLITFLAVLQYEHIVLLDLLKKGHLEPDRKIGTGIRAFQIRYHPQFKSRCYFVIREDGSVDDFSFRKCVDHILPLPENMQVKHEANKDLARGGKGGGHGRGRGRGGKPRYWRQLCVCRNLLPIVLYVVLCCCLVHILFSTAFNPAVYDIMVCC